MTLKACISIFHELFVDILQNEFQYDLSPHQATQIKEVLSKMEFKMGRSEVPFHVQREQNLQDFLDELWIGPSCEWIDSTDFWPKLPPLMRRKEMKQTNSLPCTDHLFNIHPSLHSEDKILMFSDEICRLSKSELIGKMPHGGANYVSSSVLATLNSYHLHSPVMKDYSKLSRSKLNALSINAELVSLIDELGCYSAHKCTSVSSIMYHPYCMKNELIGLFKFPKLMSSNIFPSGSASPSFNYFPITSSVCFPPSYHCCLEQTLLDCFEAIAPLCTKWCVSQAFLNEKALEVLKFSLQCEDLQISEVACKVLAGLSKNEHFVKFAAEKGIKEQLESLVKNNHFGIKIAATRAYLNIISSAVENLRDISWNVFNDINRFLLFSNEDGSQPKYNEGIYPIPNATNLNGTSGIDIITEKRERSFSTSLNTQIEDEVIESSVQNLCPKNSEKTSVTDDEFVDIVLVHGILGGAGWTWRQHDSMRDETKNYTWCWPRDWLQEDFPNVNFRVISVNYPEPGATNNERSLKCQGESLKKSLLKAGIGQRPVFWICHSRGGLILKSIFNSAFEEKKSGKVSEGVKMLDSSVGVVFLSTPHFGAPLVPLVKTLKPSILEISEMNYNSELLMEMNSKFEDVVLAHKLPIVSVVDKLSNKIFGFNFKIVPEVSANPGFGELIAVDENHLDICKPKDRSSEVYRIIVKFLRHNLKIPRER